MKLPIPQVEPQAQPNATKKLDITVNIRKIPFFSELSDSEVEKVKESLRVRLYSRGNVILQKGSTADSLLFLLSGQIQAVDITNDGRTLGYRIMTAGEFFGELSIINTTVRSASVIALSETLVAFLPAAHALHLFMHSPPVARLMLKHLATRIQHDAEQRALLSIQNTSKRVFSFVAQIKDKSDGNRNIIENMPTHQEIANMINTSRETVTRSLQLLAKMGIIQKEAHYLVIVKPEALQQLLHNP